jgi:hypothetical protein
VPELPWYASLREAYRPGHIRVLLIGESAPDARGGKRRFFYHRALTGDDNLFRGVVLAFYNVRLSVSDSRDKSPWLERLRDDGIFLIDLVPYPINGKSGAEKNQARRQHAGACVAWAVRLRPDGVLVCHEKCFRVLSGPLRAAGLPLLHDDPIPFPLGNYRQEFAAKVRAAAGVQISPS